MRLWYSKLRLLRSPGRPVRSTLVVRSSSDSIPTLHPERLCALPPAASHPIPISFSGTGTEGDTKIKRRYGPGFRPRHSYPFASVLVKSIVIDDRYSKLSSSTGLKLSARPPQSTSQTKPIQSSSRGFEQLPSSWGEVCVVSPIVGLHVQQSEICCCIGVVFAERLWFIQVECQRDDRRRSVKG